MGFVCQIFDYGSLMMDCTPEVEAAVERVLLAEQAITREIRDKFLNRTSTALQMEK